MKEEQRSERFGGKENFKGFRNVSSHWFISCETVGFKSDSPSRSGADAAGHCTAACIFGVHRDTVLFALSQSVLNALFDLALICFASGYALHVHRAAWYFLTAIFHVNLVATAVVRQISRFVLSVTKVLHFYLTWYLVWSLKGIQDDIRFF